MSDTPRTDAVVPHSLFDHTDADYMALVNLAHAMERELAAVIALCERMDSGAADPAVGEKDASASTGCEYEIDTQKPAPRECHNGTACTPWDCTYPNCTFPPKKPEASLQRYSQSETAEFAIYEGDEFFADVSGPRERAWCEAMSYASQVDNPRIEEVVRTPAPMGELPPLSVYRT
jgi:hypothetical protein